MSGNYLGTITSRRRASAEECRALVIDLQVANDGQVVVWDYDSGELLVMPADAAREYLRFHDAEIRDR